MKTSNNTVLITGGSAGIGFEIAKLLTEQGNHVIITGRNEERLNAAAAKLHNVSTIAFDVSKEADIQRLATTIAKDFPEVNILINNAGQAYYYSLLENENIYENAADEMLVNYLAIINLNQQLLPVLSKNDNAAIVNVSSVVAFAPSGSLATYSASKAALHSYTQSLRHALAQTTDVKVFELMPPLVNTDFSKAIGGENGIAPSVVADALLQAFTKDEYEIHVAGTADLRQLFFADPEAAFNMMNPVKERI
jgi:uncharacterized oxidoreductase